MRAVVDNRDLAALNGARPGRTSQFAWALGTSMSAIAGIFLAEELSNLSVETLTLFIVDAFAAAIIGRLKSLPLTYVGGMIIGLSIAFQQNFLTWSGRWSSASFAIPTMILFLALLFLPQARIEGRRITSTVTPRVPSMQRAAVGMLVLFGFILVNAFIWERIGIRNLTLVLLVAFPMLSLVPLTGWSGQISLAQITFVGVGAWAFIEFSSSGGQVFGLDLFSNGSPWGLLVAALVAVPIGLLMALPALRLQGLYLALATMAFARMSEFVIFDQPEVFGNEGKRIAPLSIFGFKFNEPFTLLGFHFPADSAYMLFVTAMFCIVGLGVVWLRRGRFGRRLVAMRDSPAACATLGVNLFSTKLAVFGISAAIAGFGGALAGIELGSAGTSNFQMINGLSWLLLLVVGGVAVVSGAVFGGFALQSFVWLTLLFPASVIFEWWQRIGPGLAGIGIGRRPDGVIPHVGAELRERRAEQQKKRRPPSLEGGEEAATADTAAPVPAPGA
jgi:branched-chain amino acid transport system permease protein